MLTLLPISVDFKRLQKKEQDQPYGFSCSINVLFT